jgi:hypothetical protein
MGSIIYGEMASMSIFLLWEALTIPRILEHLVPSFYAEPISIRGSSKLILMISIDVLPLANKSGDPQLEAFCAFVPTREHIMGAVEADQPASVRRPGEEGAWHRS